MVEATHMTTNEMQTAKEKAGDLVTYSGYEGVVIRHYYEGMFEVRLDSGDICVSGCSLKSFSNK